MKKDSLFPENFIPEWKIPANFILPAIKSNWNAGFTCVSLGAFKIHAQTRVYSLHKLTFSLLLSVPITLRMKLLHIGFSNVVSLDKVVAIISPESAVARRIREAARDKNALIDCTMGRKLRSMILTDSEFTFLSSLRTEALLQRVDQSNSNDSEKDAAADV